MYIKKFDRAQINFKRTIVLAVLITAFIVGLLGTAVKADEKMIINYENRPGSMMIKDNYGTILAVLNTGKVKLTEAGSAYFVVNTQTHGKVYLLNKADNTVKFIITSKYFKNHRATLHMLTDSDGILTNVSVTLKDYLGFIHEIPVLEFVAMVEKNLEAGILSAEKALEQAIQQGADQATQDALNEAVSNAVKGFSAFELFLQGLGLNSNNDYLLHNGDNFGDDPRLPSGTQELLTDSNGNVSIGTGDYIGENGGIENGSGTRANVTDPSK